MFGHDGQIRIALADFTTCVRSKDGKVDVFTYYCSVKENPSEGFEYDEESGLLKEKRSEKCLAVMKVGRTGVVWLTWC